MAAVKGLSKKVVLDKIKNDICDFDMCHRMTSLRKLYFMTLS